MSFFHEKDLFYHRKHDSYDSDSVIECSFILSMLKLKNDHHMLSALSICCVLVYFAANSTHDKTQIELYLKNIPISLNQKSSHIESFNNPEHTTTLKTPIEAPINKPSRTFPTVPINKQILQESSKIDINYSAFKILGHSYG